jgi:rhamnogalacturonan endolyase
MKLLRLLFFSIFLFAGNSAGAQKIMENLGRGVVAINQEDGKVYVGWRLLATDADETAFNVYRLSASKRPVKINAEPVKNSTNFIDKTANLTQTNQYFVKPLLKNKELAASQSFTLAANAAVQQYLSIPLQIPASGEVMGSSFSYSANDASVGDVDGDGEYEIILKWQPSNAKNPPQTGFTGNTIIDCYKLNGTRLWRIDLGKNIRSGAAYTQFMVYDFDGDGKAEMMCKTADGAIDGKGNVIGDGSKDWRTYGDPKGAMYGKIVTGPEYISVFDGLTGAALATKNYVPDRYP